MSQLRAERAKVNRKDAVRIVSCKRSSRAKYSLRQEASVHPMGNQAMQGMLLKRVQAKLKVSQPGDQYEQEADRVAEMVMRMSDSEIMRVPSDATELQRDNIFPSINWASCPKCYEDEKLHRKTPSPAVMTLAERVSRRSPESNASPEITPEIESQISSMRDSGHPLPQSIRSFFELRFGYDFSKVRIYANEQASQAARTLNANAFAIGSNIIFDYQRYRTGTEAGRYLLAHELTRVIQQGAISNSQKLSINAIKSLAGKNTDVSKSNMISRSIDHIYSGFPSKLVQRQANNPKVAQGKMTEERANKIVESFPPIVKGSRDLNSKVKRKIFMENMPLYFDENFEEGVRKTKDHFSAIIEVFSGKTYPKPIFLHTDAAKALEKVCKEVGEMNMPSTPVAFALRGRIDGKVSKGLMGHPLGYAIDYGAYKNPHIADPVLNMFINIIIKDINYESYGELARGWKERRELVSGLYEGKIEYDSAKAKKLFAIIDKEMDRLADRSELFQKETSGNKEELLKIKSIYWDSTAKYEKQKARFEVKIRRARGKLDRIKSQLSKVTKQNLIQKLEPKKRALEDEVRSYESKVEELYQKIAAFNELKSIYTEDYIKSRLPIIFGKWIERIDEKIIDIKNKYPKIDTLTKKDLEAEKKNLRIKKKNLSGRITLIRTKDLVPKDTDLLVQHPYIYIHTLSIKTMSAMIKKELSGKSPNQDKIKKLTDHITQANIEIEEIQRDIQEILQKEDDIKVEEALLKNNTLPLLDRLKKSLTGDINFVIGKGVRAKNPSIIQLIESGFFNPDLKFNKIFRRSMTKHGFDHGIDWDFGPDTMHLEFIPGMLKIKGPRKEKPTKPAKRK